MENKHYEFLTDEKMTLIMKMKHRNWESLGTN